MPGPVFVPSTSAPTHAGRFRSAARAGLDDGLRSPFLTDVFGPQAQQSVEAAFGADLNGDPDLWVWTDITTACQWEPGVEATIGYPDEAISLVPAKFTALLRNDQAGGGDFTLGNATGRYWPDIRENTPIRARLDVGNGASIRFQGYATSWKPKRGAGGERFVALLANGVSRRLRQGKTPARSPIRRYLSESSLRPVAYWHLEDPNGATSAASGLAGGAPMVAAGGSAAGAGVNFGVAQGRTQGAFTGFEITKIATRSFVSLAEGGSLTATLPAGSGSTWTVQFIGFAYAYTGGAGANIVLARWTTPGGPFVRYDVRLRSADGIAELAGFDSAGAETVLCNAGFVPIDEYDYKITVTQNGGNLDTSFTVARVVSTGAVGSTTTDSRAGTLALPSVITLNPDLATADGSSIAGSENQHRDVRFGHLGVWFNSSAAALYGVNISADTGYKYSPWSGYIGESPTERLTRLCLREGVSLDVIGTSDMPMSAQSDAAFLDLIKEPVVVDQGTLLDGLGPGYTYITRTSAYSASPSLTLDASGGGDIVDLDIQQDDQGRVNDYTARNPDGGEAQFTQPDGPLGTATVGTYDSGDDHRAVSPADLFQIAAWKVAQGTVGGLRYPRLKFELAKIGTARLAQQWLSALPLDRVDADGINTGSNPDRALLLRGWNEKWNSKTWTVTTNLTPFDVFGVVVLAGDTGDTDPFVGWLDIDGSTTQDGIAAGATSVVVVTPSGPVWTNATTPSPNYADDITGLYVDLDGMRVGVTAISGATSPQTFTIVGADVLRAVPAGAPVTVADPVVLGL